MIRTMERVKKKNTKYLMAQSILCYLSNTVEFLLGFGHMAANVAGPHWHLLMISLLTEATG